MALSDKANSQYLPLQNYNTIDGFPNNAVTAITQDEKGYLWIGTQAGLSRFDGFQFTTYNTSHGLAGNIVVEIQIDREGGFWVGTDQGLSHFDGDSIQTYRYENRVTENTLWDIHAEKTGDVWMATNGAGILHRSPEGNFNLLRAEGDDDVNTIFSVIKLSDGRLLAGGRGGLFVKSGNELQKLHSEELPNAIVTEIFEDSHGRIWLGYQRRSIHRIEGGRIEELAHIPFESARSMIEDDRGTIWIGGDGDGLLAVHPNDEFEIYTSENGLLGNEIGALHQDSDGSIWIGQLYQGLERLSNRGILHYRFGTGDASFINSIFQAQNDDIWISTMNGVVQLSGTEHIRHAE